MLKPITYGRLEVVHRRGQAAEDIIFLLDGSVASLSPETGDVAYETDIDGTHLMARDPRSQTLYCFRTLQTGGCFGESVFIKPHRERTVVCTRAATALYMSRDDLMLLSRKFPKAMRRLRIALLRQMMPRYEMQRLATGMAMWAEKHQGSTESWAARVLQRVWRRFDRRRYRQTWWAIELDAAVSEEEQRVTQEAIRAEREVLSAIAAPAVGRCARSFRHHAKRRLRRNSSAVVGSTLDLAAALVTSGANALVPPMEEDLPTSAPVTPSKESTLEGMDVTCGGAVSSYAGGDALHPIVQQAVQAAAAEAARCAARESSANTSMSAVEQSDQAKLVAKVAVQVADATSRTKALHTKVDELHTLMAAFMQDQEARWTTLEAALAVRPVGATVGASPMLPRPSSPGTTERRTYRSPIDEDVDLKI